MLRRRANLRKPEDPIKISHAHKFVHFYNLFKLMIFYLILIISLISYLSNEKGEKYNFSKYI